MFVYGREGRAPYPVHSALAAGQFEQEVRQALRFSYLKVAAPPQAPSQVGAGNRAISANPHRTGSTISIVYATPSPRCGDAWARTHRVIPSSSNQSVLGGL